MTIATEPLFRLVRREHDGAPSKYARARTPQFLEPLKLRLRLALPLLAPAASLDPNDRAARPGVLAKVDESETEPAIHRDRGSARNAPAESLVPAGNAPSRALTDRTQGL
jgi:hypothetical protein